MKIKTKLLNAYCDHSRFWECLNLDNNLNSSRSINAKKAMFDGVSQLLKQGYEGVRLELYISSNENGDATDEGFQIFVNHKTPEGRAIKFVSRLIEIGEPVYPDELLEAIKTEYFKQGLDIPLPGKEETIQ